MNYGEMSMLRRAFLLTSVCAAVLAASAGVHAQRAKGPAVATPLPKASPDVSGMSASRLERIGTVLNREIEQGRLPGAVVMVARRGRLVYQGAWGFQDPVKKTPMQADSIFRIYSMTKPLVSIAAMLLMEDGDIQLTDPVSKHLPSFKDLRVYVGGGEIAPERAMTVQDLLRHTAGLAYGELTKNLTVKDALVKAGLANPGVRDYDSRAMTGPEQVERLSKIPLIHHPGTTWEYSLASDVLGRVVEAASGKRLGDFLSERVFQPLKMVDTGFFVPADKIARLAEPFETDPASGNKYPLIDVSAQPGNDSGGAGGVSTASDYLRFAQMLLAGGALDGTRVASRTTIQLMASDHLGLRVHASPTPGELLLGAHGYTFGLGFAVRATDGIAGVPGSAGEFMWAGYAGTFFWIDPKEQIAAVYMTQAPSTTRAAYCRLIKQLVYQAID
jgi:CubicO group peptidase (beta-lactamase class C family)